MKWFFHLAGDTVVLQSRVEDDAGTIIGDAFSEVQPGGTLLNLSYAELVTAGAGVIENRERERPSGAMRRPATCSPRSLPTTSAVIASQPTPGPFQGAAAAASLGGAATNVQLIGIAAQPDHFGI
jgi:hypothetical protein